ncbi:hypothetical protein DFA_00855 [Cavenderia fasciculata]|uniref:Uncharacterized protein n=1 Tax=Cavenderia fasciculata TaxID=261658 RepID=F4PU60_CACFS|nr:uncharacterized protein DFA_00855 [Cavenderia fasciculata]EGG20986.1 hypothetical protein DFA_00855 [Cavenderia fasciculata]|eukprot:XP_004358836.1 hypothetical protein DFA_00855 [Cavenderia fasciculata]
MINSILSRSINRTVITTISRLNTSSYLSSSSYSTSYYSYSNTTTTTTNIIKRTMSTSNTNNNNNNNKGCCDPEARKPQPQQGGGKKKGEKKVTPPSKYVVFTPAVIDMPDDAKYIDSHCHVDQTLQRLNKMLPDFPQFVKDNYPPQFEACVQVCCDPVSMEYTDFLVQYPQIYAAYGVHPHNAKDYTDTVESKLIERMSHPKTVAWGEMGLDYYYKNSTHDQQKIAFRRQLGVAVPLGKPLVIHSRDAEEDTIAILKELVPKDYKIHIHCLTSSNQPYILQLLEHFSNLCIGFTGCITFKSSDPIRDSLAIIPLDRLLLETDAPYMTPEPFRGQIAHSGHIPHVANLIAQIKGTSVEAVLKQCRENTKKIYGI